MLAHEVQSRDEILVIEDDPEVRAMIGYLLMKNGYALEEAADAEEAQEVISRRKPDLIVMDWMLPGLSGVDYARNLRSEVTTRDIPIIMLTARGDESDKIYALDVGADDYMTKPFSNKEFLARIRAIIRRKPESTLSQTLELNGLVVDLSNHQVTAKGQSVQINYTEFRLLYFFFTHPDKVYSREQLIERIWGENSTVEEQTINVYIRRLRKALLPHGYDSYIQTVRNVGYRFSAN